MRAGNGSLLSQEFLALNEYACRYITAKDLANNHRKFSGVTEEDAAYEAATRRNIRGSIPDVLGKSVSPSSRDCP